MVNAGGTQERRSSGPNTKEQHNGIDPISLHSDHPELSDRGPNDKHGQQPGFGACVWGPEPNGVLRKVLQHIGLLSVSFPSERAVN